METYVYACSGYFTLAATVNLLLFLRPNQPRRRQFVDLAGFTLNLGLAAFGWGSLLAR
jgi:hypothetical protein